MNQFEQVKHKVCSVISNNITNHNEQEIMNTTDLFNMGLNSLNTIQVVMDLEEAFNFEFDYQKISYENFKTVTSISNFIFSETLNKTK